MPSMCELFVEAVFRDADKAGGAWVAPMAEADEKGNMEIGGEWRDAEWQLILNDLAKRTEEIHRRHAKAKAKADAGLGEPISVVREPKVLILK